MVVVEGVVVEVVVLCGKQTTAADRLYPEQYLWSLSMPHCLGWHWSSLLSLPRQRKPVSHLNAEKKRTKQLRHLLIKNTSRMILKIVI